MRVCGDILFLLSNCKKYKKERIKREKLACGNEELFIAFRPRVNWSCGWPECGRSSSCENACYVDKEKKHERKQNKTKQNETDDDKSPRQNKTALWLGRSQYHAVSENNNYGKISLKSFLPEMPKNTEGTFN